jgi:hypothetical protein
MFSKLCCAKFPKAVTAPDNILWFQRLLRDRQADLTEVDTMPCCSGQCGREGLRVERRGKSRSAGDNPH